jgi:hypothetical protein
MRRPGDEEQKGTATVKQRRQHGQVQSSAAVHVSWKNIGFPMHSSVVRTPSPCLYIKVFVPIHLEADNVRTAIPLGDSYKHISLY